MDGPWNTTTLSLRQGMIAPFWTNVLASSYLDVSIGIADRQRITPEGVTARLATKPRWLTPFTVHGFRQEEFQFLSPEELKRLKDGVSGVRAVVAEMRPDQPSTEEQRERALPHFLTILEVLAYDRYGDVPALILGKQIQRRLASNWPQFLDHLRFETGLDSTGDPGLWVWAFVAESGEHDEDAFFEAVDSIKPTVGALARDLAPESRVYLRFRSTLDQLEPEGVAA